MEIYIDVLFFINFVSDFLLLILCDMSFKKRLLKKLVASIIGSLYACLFVLNIPKVIYSPIAKMLVLGIMCYISFYPCSIKVFFEKCTLFLVVSMLFCGVIYAGPLLLNSTDIPWIFLVFTAFFVTKLTFTKIKNKLYSKKCKLKIYYNNSFVTIHAMIDTGNVLKEPISGMPVLVIDEEILKRLFSPSATRNNLCEFVNPEDFRIIPYKTISASGVTYGFIPQKLFFEDKEIKDTVIAVAPSPICTDALIHPQLI